MYSHALSGCSTVFMGELRVEREQKARPHPALSPRRGKRPPGLGVSSRQPVRSQFLRRFCEGATRQEGVRTRQTTRKQGAGDTTQGSDRSTSRTIFFSKNENFRSATDLLYRLVVAYASENVREKERHLHIQ